MYRVEISESRLNQFRVITASDPDVLQTKVQAQRRTWEEMWRRKVEANQRKAKLEQRTRDREKAAREKSEKVQLATTLTMEAERALADAEEILTVALRARNVVDWESMKDRSPFQKPKPEPPEKPLFPEKPDKSSIPPKLGPDDSRFQPNLKLLDNLIPGRKDREVERAKAQYQAYREQRTAAIHDYNQQVARHNERVQEIEQKYADEMITFRQRMKSWESERQDFENQQAIQHQSVDLKKKAYLSHDADGVLDFCETVLMNSVYPAFCPKIFDCEYIPESKTLVIDYSLPRIEDLPSRKAAKYNQSQDNVVYTELSDSALNRLYALVSRKKCTNPCSCETIVCTIPVASAAWCDRQA